MSKQSSAQSEFTKTFRGFLVRIRTGIDSYLLRRPHRSFQVSRRRDYTRTLQLPGYWRFSGAVWTILWRNKKLFGLLSALYAVLYALLVGVISQDTYLQLSSSVNEIGSQVVDGNLAGMSQGIALYITTLTSNMNGQLDATKQTYVGLLGLLLWLTVVWLLRAVMAGQSPRLRDGLYNAGAPIVSTAAVAVVLTVQLLPIALAAIGYSAASASGLLSGGVETMLFWLVACLLVVLSLYWMTSTFIALVVVTLPGMYPVRALRAAGDLVLGRRLKILWRILWMFLLLALAWTIVVLPMVFFDGWLKSVWPVIQWLPLVPGILLIMVSVSLVYSASYVYVLYRGIVDDDTRSGQN